MNAREIWREWYRALRIARRDQSKAWEDALIYGTGIVMFPNDGRTPYRVRPDDYFTELK